MTPERRSTAEKPGLDNDEKKICGYAAVYGVRSVDLGGFVEELSPGCFDRCIAEGQDVRCLFNHDPNMVLGRTVAGTCRIACDAHGLRYESDLADRQLDRDLKVSMKRGDITGSSFAFTVAPDGDSWRQEESGLIVRTISRVDHLYDVSPVTYPAYQATEACVRARTMADARKAAVAAADQAAIAKAESIRKETSQRLHLWRRHFDLIAGVPTRAP